VPSSVGTMAAVKKGALTSLTQTFSLALGVIGAFICINNRGLRDVPY